MVDRGSIISRYRIIDRIAEGGMGEVYRAKMETLGGAEKVIALKVVRKDLAENEEFASLFIDEARLAMGLSHVNIVQSFDAGKIDDQLFLAMEYVAGFHLGDLLQACVQRFKQPLPHKHLIYIAVEALTSVMEPILIVFMGGAVGFIVIALFLPLIRLIEGIA